MFPIRFKFDVPRLFFYVGLSNEVMIMLLYCICTSGKHSYHTFQIIIYSKRNEIPCLLYSCNSFDNCIFIYELLSLQDCNNLK